MLYCGNPFQWMCTVLFCVRLLSCVYNIYLRYVFFFCLRSFENIWPLQKDEKKKVLWLNSDSVAVFPLHISEPCQINESFHSHCDSTHSGFATLPQDSLHLGISVISNLRHHLRVLLQCVGISLHTHARAHTCAHTHTCCQCKKVQLTKRIHFPDIMNPYWNIVDVYTYVHMYVSVLGVSMCHHVLCLSDALACVLPGFLWSVGSRPGGVTASFPQPVCRELMPCPSKTSTLSTTNDSQPPPQQKHHSNHLRVPGGFAAWQLQFESVALL